MKKQIVLLSTRPLKESVHATARQYNLSVTDTSFIRTRPSVSPGQAQALLQLHSYLVFTSANAVKAFSQNITEYDLPVPAHHVFCLQGDTLAALSPYPSLQVIGTAKNAVALANLITQQETVKAVSFICGNRRRNDLPYILKKHSIDVQEVEIYSTLLCPHRVADAYEAVAFFSPSAAEAFFQANILRPHIPCFCIGQVTAAAVKEFTSNPIIASDTPSQEALLQTVIHHFHKSTKKMIMTDTNFSATPTIPVASTGNDLLLKALRGEEVPRPPVWMMRQAGRYLPQYMEVKKKYDFFTRVQTPELASAITLQPINIIGTDAAIIFSDILVVPQAMGMTVEMHEGKGPLLPQTISNLADVQQLIVADAPHRLQYVYDALALCKQQLAGRVPLIGFAGAPWTLLCYMIEGKGSKTFDKAKSFCYQQPEAAHALLQAITNVSIPYLKQQAAAGADCVQLFDSWGGLWDKEGFAAFSLPYIKQITEAVSSHCPVIVYAKGVWHSLPELQQTGAAALGLDWCNTPQAARALTNNSVTLQGNYDPARLLQSPARIRRDVQQMIAAFGPQRYIANLGHGITPNIPVDNARAFVEAVKEYAATDKKPLPIH